MFGIGPTELAVFLVIVLLVVGPDKLPTFMRTVGRGLRQLRNASRDFKEAIGLDELMKEGDPFRAPRVRPHQVNPIPTQSPMVDPPTEVVSQNKSESGLSPLVDASNPLETEGEPDAEGHKEQP